MVGGLRSLSARLCSPSRKHASTCPDARTRPSEAPAARLQIRSGVQLPHAIMFVWFFFLYISVSSPVWPFILFFFNFVCQSEFKCAKLPGSKPVPQKQRCVLCGAVVCWSSCVDWTLRASLQAGWLPLCLFFSGKSRTGSVAGSHREWPFLQRITCQQAPLLWLQLFREPESH